MPYVIRADDRLLFKRCRRAYDFGGAVRGNYVPRETVATERFHTATRRALAVYFFPGMWRWDRALVRELAYRAFVIALGEDTADSEAGRRLLGACFDRSEDGDPLVPIRTDAEFDVPIPDPGDPGAELATPGGEPLRYRGRIELLVEDASARHWLVEHRIVSQWADPADLRLDDRARSNAWAWERFFLGMKIAGTIYEELMPRTGEIRQTVVERSAAEIARFGCELALEARDMVNPELRIYPTPDRAACRPCGFRAACVIANTGRDPWAALAGTHRKRTADELDAGLFGKSTWSGGRGAALPGFPRGPT